MKIYDITFIALLTFLGGCFQPGQPGPVANPNHQHGQFTYLQRKAIAANKVPCSHKKVRKQTMPPLGNAPDWCDECYWDIPRNDFTYHCRICDYDRCETCNTRIFNNELKRLNL